MDYGYARGGGVRTRLEVQKALETVFKVQPSENMGMSWKLGAMAALEWLLGREDGRFGPEKAPRAKRIGQGRPSLGIDAGELVRLRIAGWSLTKLAKQFRCSRATVCHYLKLEREGKSAVNGV